MSRALGVIVGRGGSKRIPNKALRPLGGHPLIGWAVRAATASRLDDVIVSTDDPNIAETAHTYGASVPFERPVELATDTVTNDRVLNHALRYMMEELGSVYDVIALIQPTVPFLTPDVINECVANVADDGAACAFSARRVSIQPESFFRISSNGIATPVMGPIPPGPKRRGLKYADSFVSAGAIWALNAEQFLRGGEIYTPPYRLVELEPLRCIDIDYLEDLDRAELARRSHGFVITPGRFGGD